MKTAEEWEVIYYYETTEKCLENTHFNPKEEAISVIQQIQLDAFKAGMTEELGIIEKEQMKYSENTEIYQALQKVYNNILSARDRKESL